MKKNKKLLIKGGAILTGVFVGLPLGLQSVYAGVQQVTSQEVKDIHNKLEHLRESLKKNYLTVKNIPIWDQYIQEAKKLLERLPEGSSKEKYEERITDAEVLLTAIARVSKLEESVEANADIIGNVKVWEKYIELGKKDLGNVDKEAFKSHYNNLLERLALKNKVVEEVKVEYTQKVEALNDAYKKAEELAKTDPAKALQLLKDALDKAGKLDADGLKDKLMEAVKEAIGNIKVPEVPPPSGGGGGGTPPPPPPPPVQESPYIIEGNNVTVKPGFNNLTINSAALGISTVGLLTLPSGTNVTIDGLVVQGVIVTQGVLQTAGNLAINDTRINSMSVLGLTNLTINQGSAVTTLLERSGGVVNHNGSSFLCEFYNGGTVNASGSAVIANMVNAMPGTTLTLNNSGGNISSGVAIGGSTFLGFPNVKPGVPVAVLGTGMQFLDDFMCPSIVGETSTIYAKPTQGYKINLMKINGDMGLVNEGGYNYIVPGTIGTPLAELTFQVVEDLLLPLSPPVGLVGTDLGKITGLTTSMEVSTDGTTYVDVTDVEMVFDPVTTVKVRMKATPSNLASSSVDVAIPARRVALSPPEGLVGTDTGKITGLTTSMEVSTDGTNYVDVTDAEMVFDPVTTVKVRMKATPSNYASSSVDVAIPARILKAAPLVKDVDYFWQDGLDSLVSKADGGIEVSTNNTNWIYMNRNQAVTIPGAQTIYIRRPAEPGGLPSDVINLVYTDAKATLSLVDIGVDDVNNTITELNGRPIEISTNNMMYTPYTPGTPLNDLATYYVRVSATETTEVSDPVIITMN